MDNQRIGRILYEHFIPIRIEDGNILAQDFSTQNWIDVTRWTGSKLLAWLGQ